MVKTNVEQQEIPFTNNMVQIGLTGEFRLYKKEKRKTSIPWAPPDGNAGFIKVEPAFFLNNFSYVKWFQEGMIKC